MKNPIWNYLYPNSTPKVNPLTTTRGLPASWYTSKNLYELERRAIFAKHWLLVSHKLRFPHNGDWVRFEQAGYRFFIIRDRTGNFRAFHNFCRHRGFPLMLKDEGNAKILSCQYHGWSYSIDGKLTKAPGYKDLSDFEASSNNLLPVHLHIDQNGFIWVNLDAGDEPEIAWSDELAGADSQERFKTFDFEGFRLDHTWNMSGDYNWKALADNYNECYHCKVAHPDVADVADLDKYAVEPEGSYIKHFAKPKEEEVPEILRIASTYYFPNACMTISPHFFYLMRCVPTSAEHCSMEYEVYRHKDATDEEFEKMDSVFKRILNEDKWLCTNAQESLRAGVFINGEMHPRMEQGPLYLHHKVRQVLQSHHKLEQKLGREIWPAQQKLPFDANSSKDDELFCRNLDACANSPNLSW